MPLINARCQGRDEFETMTSKVTKFEHLEINRGDFHGVFYSSHPSDKSFYFLTLTRAHSKTFSIHTAVRRCESNLFYY